jgi:hypothetical protein
MSQPVTTARARHVRLGRALRLVPEADPRQQRHHLGDALRRPVSMIVQPWSHLGVCLWSSSRRRQFPVLTLLIMVFFLYAAGYILVVAFSPGSGRKQEPTDSLRQVSARGDRRGSLG